MQVDKTTLADLSIFHAEEEQSVFHYFNFTQTNGGREYLRHLMGNPLKSVASILDTQLTIREIMKVATHWPITITNGTIMVIERYYETQINSFAKHPNTLNSHLYKFLSS